MLWIGVQKQWRNCVPPSTVNTICVSLLGRFRCCAFRSTCRVRGTVISCRRQQVATESRLQTSCGRPLAEQNYVRCIPAFRSVYNLLCLHRAILICTSEPNTCRRTRTGSCTMWNMYVELSLARRILCQWRSSGSSPASFSVWVRHALYSPEGGLSFVLRVSLLDCLPTCAKRGQRFSCSVWAQWYAFQWFHS